MTRQELVDSMTDEQITKMWENEVDYYGNCNTTPEEELFYEIVWFTDPDNNIWIEDFMNDRERNLYLAICPDN